MNSVKKLVIVLSLVLIVGAGGMLAASKVEELASAPAAAPKVYEMTLFADTPMGPMPIESVGIVNVVSGPGGTLCYQLASDDLGRTSCIKWGQLILKEQVSE